MSFRSLGKLFKTRKTDKRENKEIILPIEGFNKSIKMLLAYSGQDPSEAVAETGREVPLEGLDSPSRCSVHSVAALRGLARSRALSGADPFEDLEIEKIVDVLIDLLHKIQVLSSEDPESNNTVCDVQVALECLAKLDAVVAANRGHMALNKLTWADFLLAGMWDHVKQALDIVASNKFNNIELLVQQLTSVPAVKSVLERIQHNEPMS